MASAASGELLLDEITSIHPPVISASGAHFALVVYAENFGNLLVQETGVSQWNRSDMPWRLAEPVFVGEELLFPVWDTTYRAGAGAQRGRNSLCFYRSDGRKQPGAGIYNLAGRLADGGQWFLDPGWTNCLTKAAVMTSSSAGGF